MLNITAGNISSTMPDHLIQFLIEPSGTNPKLAQTYCKDTIRILIKQNLKMTFTNSAGKNTVVIQIQM